MTDLNRRFVIVTGATGGIGREIALQVAAAGMVPVLACRSLGKAECVADEIRRRFGIDPLMVGLDLADPDSVERMAREVEGLPLAGLINNAGVMNASFIAGPDGMENTIAVNYVNTRRLTEAVAANFKGGEAVVFTTSATRNWFPFQKAAPSISRQEFSRMRAYALSKKLITGYAALLAGALAPKGVRCNCADPGVADTPMLRMGKWFDPLTDTLFRPFCFSPARSAATSLRAFLSAETGRIFSTPAGSRPIPEKFIRRLPDSERNLPPDLLI